MSYNISVWKTKIIRDLVIPIHLLNHSIEYQKKGWGAEKILEIGKDDLIVTVRLSEGGCVKGVLNPIDKTLRITELSLYGEGSGIDYEHVLLPALKKSTGIFSAVLVWECGDGFSSLEVVNGNVTDNPFSI